MPRSRRTTSARSAPPHYAAVKRYLDAAGVAYVEDPTLVRGLDYYTRTVFEVEAVGAGVGAIGGGGRYDGLVELEGGKPTPGLGFAVGFERIALALAAAGVEMGGAEPACVYVACTGGEAERAAAFDACLALRAAGVRTEADYHSRALRPSSSRRTSCMRASAWCLGATRWRPAWPRCATWARTSRCRCPWPSSPPRWRRACSAVVRRAARSGGAAFAYW